MSLYPDLFVPFAFGLMAYLIGSLPFAIITSRLLGMADPRQYGSGNPGATNVLRSGNKFAAALTLLGDCGKGFIVVFIVQNQMACPPWMVAFLALMVFCGHIFSIFLRGKGGKGVATALGVLLGFDVFLGLAVLFVWLLVLALTRYSSLAALVAALAAPLAALFWLALPLQAAVWVLCLLLIWRHRLNIARLKSGTETRVGQAQRTA